MSHDIDFDIGLVHAPACVLSKRRKRMMGRRIKMDRIIAMSFFV
ncbi:hypothetical protein ACFL0H_15590 [Thermodesulfobacteriota bacterium]